MATAATMQPSPIRPALVPLAPSHSSAGRQTSSNGQLNRLNSSKPASANNGPATETRQEPCDGCRRRNSRCAMNEAARKCYSCDFHRQECVFTPNTSRKRSHANSVGGAGWKTSHAGNVQSFSPLGDVHRTSSITMHNSTTATMVPTSVSYQYVGNTTDIEPTLLEHIALDKNNEAQFASTKIRKIGGDGQFVNVLDDANPRSPSSLAASEELEKVVGPYSERLVTIFFSKINPTFPVVMEKEIKRSYSQHDIDPVLLAAMFLLSSRWLERSNSSDPKLDIELLQNVAWKQFQLSLNRPRIATVQAGLLLMQCRGLGSHFISTQLVSIGFDLGLHQDCSDWMMGDSDKAFRRRLAWILYAQDKWSSLLHGRPSCITPGNWTVRPLCGEDFEDADSLSTGEMQQTNHSASLVMELIALTGILSELLEIFHTLRAEAEIKLAGPQGLRMILERAKPVQIKLKDWFSHLPSYLKMDANETITPFCGMLHLAYFATEITLHRCIIRATSHEGTDSYLAYICRSAAKTRLISAMDFVNRLRPAHLKSFWPLASFSNFALIGTFGVLLRSTATTEEEAEFYRMRLEEYRWTLAVSSNKADFLDYAINSLDVNTGLLQNMPTKPEMADILPATRDQSTSTPSAPTASSHRGRGSSSTNFGQGSSSAFSGLVSPVTSSPNSSSGQDSYLTSNGF